MNADRVRIAYASQRQYSIIQPIRKHWFICGLYSHLPSYDDIIYYSVKAHETQNSCDESELLPRSAFCTADKNNTAPKCTIVGVANEGAPSSARSGVFSAISVKTTNCNPISALADGPIIKKKLFHASRSDTSFAFMQFVAFFDNPFLNSSKRYANSGPFSTLYVSCPISSANGSKSGFKCGQ